MSLIYLNGKLLPETDAKVSVFDHGFLYGDGIFETMRTYNGKIFQLDAHLTRLFASACAISLKIPYNKTRLSEALYLTLKANNLANTSLRLTISRGEGAAGLDPDNCPKPTVVIMPRKAPALTSEIYQKGVTVIIAKTRRMPPNALSPEIKSLNFLNNILAKIEAKTAKAFDAIMLNQDDYLCESTVSNIFFVKQGTLKTPSKQTGLLSGITRKVVLKLAQQANIPCEEGLFQKEDVCNCDEVFLTNSGIELLPVIKIDYNVIGNGTPGKFTQYLHKLFKANLEQGAYSNV